MDRTQDVVCLDAGPQGAGNDNAAPVEGLRPKLQSLSARHLRLAVEVIEYYARHGTAPTPKYLAFTVYGRWRQVIRVDINKLIEAGVLMQDKRFGVRTLRPTPEYRLPFADEIALPEGARGKLVGRLKQQLKQKEDHHVEVNQ